MSHITEVKCQVRNLAALQQACKRLGLGAPVNGSHTLYTKKGVQGYAVSLPNWRYPAVFDLKGGCQIDNYNGVWGKRSELDRLHQAYGVELAKAELRKKGFRPVEHVRADGSIEVTCTA